MGKRVAVARPQQSPTSQEASRTVPEGFVTPDDPEAPRTIRMTWSAQKPKAGVVEVEVSDGGGPSVPRPAPPALWATSGRGLRLVRSLAHEWGVTEDKSGRTVWASLGGPSRRRSH